MTLQEFQVRKIKVNAIIQSWSAADQEIAVILLRDLMNLTVGYARRSLASRLFGRGQEEPGGRSNGGEPI